MNKADIQRDTELYYNKDLIRDAIRSEMEQEEELMDLIDSAVTTIDEWSNRTFNYASKNERMDAYVEFNDTRKIVEEIMITIMNLDDQTDLLTSIVGQTSGLIKGMDKPQAVVTIAEIITLMCDEDLFDMEKSSQVVTDEESLEEYETMSWYISNPWELSKELRKRIARSMYLPPMIVEPNILKHNRSSGYLTKKPESLILGHGNHHNESICLDSLNRFNQVALSLNEEMLTQVGEIIDDKRKQAFLKDPKRKEQYYEMLKQSYHVYAYLIKHGNKFWLEHKTDKRGRTYAQG